MYRINPPLKEYLEQEARKIIETRKISRGKNGRTDFTICVPEELLRAIKDGDCISLSNPPGEVYFSVDEERAQVISKEEYEMSSNLVGCFFPKPQTFYDTHNLDERLHKRTKPLDVPYVPYAERMRSRIYSCPKELRHISE